MLEGYYVGAVERNTASEAFDYETFKGLLTRLFTVEQLSLIKVESDAFRDLLTYCNPRCKAALPSRTGLRSYITSAYERALPAIELELASASSRINLSFNL